jgi:hypothetical protein
VIQRSLSPNLCLLTIRWNTDSAAGDCLAGWQHAGARLGQSDGSVGWECTLPGFGVVSLFSQPAMQLQGIIPRGMPLLGASDLVLRTHWRLEAGGLAPVYD